MEFLHGNTESNTGFFILEWESNREEITLFQNSKEGWFPVYTGGLNKLSFSGLSNGSYKYALCPNSLTSPLNQNCAYTKIVVEHYSLTQSFFSLGIGIGLFLAIVLTLSAFLIKSKRIST